MLENLINNLETENRSRLKRNQHPLTYQEAYSLLTQLIGGDVLHACQSAKSSYNSHGDSNDDIVSNNNRNNNNHRGNQRGNRGGRGKSSSGRGKSSNKGRQQEQKNDPVWAHCRDFNAASGCSTQNCPKKHTCSQRMSGGIICNQKTHGRSTHEDQY